MALKVWLPLNGNLNNYGTSSLTYTGTPTFVNGKMGKGISLTPRVTFNGLPKLDKFTILFWLKVDSCSSDWADSLGFKSVQADGTSASDFRFEATTTGRVCSFHNNSPYAITQGSRILIDTPEKGKWHYCGVSYDGAKVYTYIDGVLTYIDTGLGGYLIDRFYIGQTDAMVGGMNDLRVYDECLSDKQIKEISKGLVAHYKLSGNGAENLCRLTNETWDRWSHNASSGTSSKSVVKDNGIKTLRIDVTEASTGWQYDSYNISESRALLKTNTVYTISFDYKANISSELSVVILDGNGTNRISNATKTMSYNGSEKWKHIVLKTTTLSEFTLSNQVLYFYGFNRVGYYMIKNLKFEEGDVATPWKPAPTDTLYKQLGYDKIIAQDCSGYDYNGKIDGTLKVISDSCKYETSVNFNTPGYLHYLTSPINVNTDAFTYSIWFKPDRNATMALYNDRSVLGGGFSLFYLNGSFRFDTGTNNQMQATNAIPSLNQWNHVVVTFNKETGKKVYLNGELKDYTTKPGELSTIGQYASIGNSSANGAAGAGNQVYGNLSDARLYCTELSANDVLTLYKTSGIIDNKGNVYAYEFVEEA